jgi:hypothetical protein
MVTPGWRPLFERKMKEKTEIQGLTALRGADAILH